jgi:hypothetical protein
MATPKGSQAEQTWQAPVEKPTLEKHFLQPSSDSDQLSPWVCQLVTLFEAFDAHVGVDLSCSKARVT